MTKGYPNEVGPQRPDLQKRVLDNPIASWVGRFITKHRRHPMPECHVDLYDDLAYGKDDEVFILPRSFAKTTVCSENVAIYLACELSNIRASSNHPVYPYDRVHEISGTGSKAEEIMSHIKTELETNPEILATYGDLRGDKWNEREIKTKDGFELRVGGAGCQIRGFRPKIVIGDDLEDDEEVRSDERMQKAREWMDSAVLNVLDEEECRGFFLGTVLHPDALLNYLSTKPGIVTRRYKAYFDGVMAEGHELWPSKWPHWRLQKRLAKIGHRAFMENFMNEPQISENPIFVRNWFREYDPKDNGFQDLLSKSLYTVETCDPATSKKDKTDNTAIVVMSATFEDPPRVFVRKVDAGHWPNSTTVIKLFNYYQEYFANAVGIETVAYQQVLADEFKWYMEKNRLSIDLKCLIPDGDKERRANAVQPMVQRGQVFYDPNDPEQVRLVDECVNFQPGVMNMKKDRMDAAIYALDMVKQWGGRKRESGSKRVLPKGARVNEFTGVVS